MMISTSDTVKLANNLQRISLIIPEADILSESFVAMSLSGDKSQPFWYLKTTP